MPNPRLVALALEIESIKERLLDLKESRERRVLLQEMGKLINEADEILQDYGHDFRRKSA